MATSIVLHHICESATKTKYYDVDVDGETSAGQSLYARIV